MYLCPGFIHVYVTSSNSSLYFLHVCIHQLHQHVHSQHVRVCTSMTHVYHDIMNTVCIINSIMNVITYQTIIVFRHLHDKTIVDSVQFAQDNHVTWAVSVSTAIHQLHFRSSGVPTADHRGACSGWEPCTQNFDSDMQGA